MRKFTQNLLLLSAASLFLFSCGEDEEPTASAPSVTVTASVDGTSISSGDNVEVGSVVDFSVAINAPGGVNGLTINGTSVSRTQLGAEAGDVSATYTFSSNAIAASDLGLVLTTTIVAVDDLGQESAEVVFEINPSSPTARSYSTVLLAAPTGDLMNKNFFSVSAGATYSSDDVTSTAEAVSPTIDFGYYYGANDEASIASPEGFKSTVFSGQVTGWTTTNQTSLRTTTLTSSDVTEITTYADIDAAFDAGTADDNGVVSGLVEGQVLAFETVGGVRGIILVTAIDPGFESNDSITIDVLAQLAAN